MKPGVRTSEFWLSMIAVIVGSVIASGVLPETHWIAKIAGVVSAVLASLGYSISRGIAKCNGESLAVMPVESKPVEVKNEKPTDSPPS